MAVQFAGGGENGRPEFNMDDDQRILEINSPLTEVGGPYTIVHKNIDDRWAIVTLNYGDSQCLGFRYFDRSSGFPQTGGNATWMILPNTISSAFLKSHECQLSSKQIWLVERFLDGRINGAELREQF